MNRFFNAFFAFVVMSFVAMLPVSSLAVFEAQNLTIGWYSWDPYHFQDMTKPDKKLTGLDTALVESIFKNAGYMPVFRPVLWKKQLQDIESGAQDAASGATKTKAREEFAYFSIPYRFEENSLFVKRGTQDDFNASSLETFFDTVKSANLKIAVLDGFVYADERLNQWIDNLANQNYIVKTQTDQESLDLLLAGEVNGFLADRLVGSTIVWRQKLTDEVTEINLHIKTPIHFMFSKKTTSVVDVNRINQSIERVKQSSEFNEIIRTYLYPVVLLQTSSTWWFQFMEILGTFAFAISGVLIAFRQNATLFGTFLLALLPSFGGGILRDLLVQRDPIGILVSPLYIGIVGITVLLGFIAIRYIKWEDQNTEAFKKTESQGATALMVTDAIGLAAFTVTGVIIAVLAQVKPLWLWGGFFAFLTAAGGSILRDIVSDQQEITALSESIYAEIAIIWGVLLSVFLIFQSDSVSADPIKYAVGVTIIGAFLTRIACYYLKVDNIRLRKQENKN